MAGTMGAVALVPLTALELRFLGHANLSATRVRSFLASDMPFVRFGTAVHGLAEVEVVALAKMREAVALAVERALVEALMEAVNMLDGVQ